MSACSISSNCSSTSLGPANQLFLTLIQTLAINQCGISPPNIWPPDYGEEALTDGFGSYDFIVIGSGSAGAIVASRLSEIEDWKILLLEAGGDPPMESEVPGYAADLMDTSVDWQSNTPAESICLFTDDKRCHVPRGKMLGGTSSINWMLYVRGAPDDFDEWARAGNDGWSYEDVLPYFKKSEGNQNETLVAAEDGRLHSADGPVKITTTIASSLDDNIKQLLQESGVDIVDDINTEKYLGFTQTQQIVYNGTRSSTAEAYLTADKVRPNLHIVKHAYVDRVLLDENNKAYGVEFTYKDQHKMSVNCTKEVIVSAGSIQSPTLLMRSGIGPKEHLEEHDIPCKVDLPVGENYIDHIFVIVPFKYENITTEPDQSTSLDSLFEYLIHRTGPLSSLPIMTAEVDTTNSTGLSDIQLFLMNYAPGQFMGSFSLLKLFNRPQKYEDFLTEANKESAISLFFVTLIKPKSRGVIKLDEQLRENILGNYLDEESDVETLVRGFNYIMDIMGSEAFQRAGAKQLRYDLDDCDSFEYLSDEYWKCYAQHISAPGAHQVGTSKMGMDSKSVVDSSLRVHQTIGLRQVDCGIMTNIVRGNTHAAAMMIGEKGADLIKSSYL